MSCKEHIEEKCSTWALMHKSWGWVFFSLSWFFICDMPINQKMFLKCFNSQKNNFGEISACWVLLVHVMRSWIMAFLGYSTDDVEFPKYVFRVNLLITLRIMRH